MIKYHTTPNIIDIHIKYVLCISAFQPFYCCPLYLRFSAILIAIHLITVNITFLLRANQYVRIDREYNILRRIYSLQLLSSLLWWCVVFIVVVCGVGWCLLWWGVAFGGVGCSSARTERRRMPRGLVCVYMQWTTRSMVRAMSVCVVMNARGALREMLDYGAIDAAPNYTPTHDINYMLPGITQTSPVLYLSPAAAGYGGAVRCLPPHYE